ncbi:FAD/NAD(P)-binding domain-containing protein [Trichoderma chlorosporum]
MDNQGDRPSFDVAIIGTGIVGVHLAIGLLSRNIPFTIYEQSSQMTGTGAGIAVSSAVVDSMAALHPDAPQRLFRVSKLVESFNYVNGCRDERLNLRPPERPYDRVIQPYKFHAAHRAKLVDGLLQFIPKEYIKLGKRIESIVGRGEDEKLVLQFSDGTTAEADAVIGCDGIKSRVRQIVKGIDNPRSFPHYTNMSLYRGLITMERATAALGQLAKDSVWYVGQGASMVTYPIVGMDGVPVLNMAAYVNDEQEWPDLDNLACVGRKRDVEAAFSHFGPSLKESYAYGRVVLAGDAAHSSTPHLGSGAGMGIEEALILAELLKTATERLDATQGSISKHIEAVFEAYSETRLPRTQWIVAGSRSIGIASQWRDEERGSDLDMYIMGFKTTLDTLLAYDWKDAYKQATDGFERELGASG